MNREQRNCQNCKESFVIDDQDFKFYEKIKVPPPTWCPGCRMIRRMIWRNERTLHKTVCQAPGHSEPMLSIFHPEDNFKVVDSKFWWSDDWSPLDYGRDYDFSKPFFTQFRQLLGTVPLLNLFSTNSVNSDYENHSHESKNCYLIFATVDNENVMFSRGSIHGRDSLDLLRTEKVESSYELIDCEECYRLFWSRDCVGCNDSYFLLDCKNCSNCIGCVGLRNSSYCIFNEQLSKEEFEKKKSAMNLGSRKSNEEIKTRLRELSKNFPRKYAHLLNTVNAVGDHLSYAKNCYKCFDLVGGSEDSRYVVHGGLNLKDSYDSYGIGIGELMYESIDVGLESSRILFEVVGRGGYDVFYANNCYQSNNIFGCVGLRNKQYCILNKQYTRQEYEKMIPKIIEHMNEVPYTDRKGRVYRYGEFFPPELSPFAYNETIAQEYFPLTKEEVIEKGYRWRDPETRGYKITKHPEDLPDNVKDTDDAILKETIACEHEGKCNEQCTTAFRIIESELQFYRKMNLPLPRLCPNCRHYQRLKQRNPLKLWPRKCQCAGRKSENRAYSNTGKHFHGENHCPNEFETSYSPEREEIVYCEQCYNSEIA